MLTLTAHGLGRLRVVLGVAIAVCFACAVASATAMGGSPRPTGRTAPAVRARTVARSTPLRSSQPVDPSTPVAPSKPVLAPPPPSLPAGPARILFSVTPPGANTAGVMSVQPDATGLEVSAAPALPLRQISTRLGLRVYSKILHSDSSPYSSCGAVGCSEGVTSTTEAGIAVASLDGSDEHLFTSGGYDTDPSFSPDGATIAYLSHEEVNGVVLDAVGLLSADGAGLGVLAPPSGSTYAFPVWSPDGRSIAVEQTSTSKPADLPGASAVVVLPLDGSPPRTVASGPYRDLAWSHDGRYLAGVRTRYVQYGGRTTWQPGDHATGDDVWILPLDGSAPRNVTNQAPAAEVDRGFCNSFGTALIQASDPMWSPDDRRITYLTNAAHVNELGRVKDVAVVDADGAHRLVVYHTPPQTCVQPSASATSQPTVIQLLGWS